MGRRMGAPFHDRIEVQLAFIDGAADVVGRAGVEGLDEDEAGFRRADDGQALQLHNGAVAGYVHVQVFHKAGRGFARAYAGEFLPGEVHGLEHGFLRLQ